jgi:hypothetical protein
MKPCRDDCLMQMQTAAESSERTEELHRDWNMQVPVVVEMHMHIDWPWRRQPE